SGFYRSRPAPRGSGRGLRRGTVAAGPGGTADPSGVVGRGRRRPRRERRRGRVAPGYRRPAPATAAASGRVGTATGRVAFPPRHAPRCRGNPAPGGGHSRPGRAPRFARGAALHPAGRKPARVARHGHRHGGAPAVSDPPPPSPGATVFDELFALL